LSGHSADLRLVVPVVFWAGIFGGLHSGGFPVGSFASFRLVRCSAASCDRAGFRSGLYGIGAAAVLVSPRLGVFRLGWSVGIPAAVVLA
jgi:hypothetical protein